jgi:hypothetical protein
MCFLLPLGQTDRNTVKTPFSILQYLWLALHNDYTLHSTGAKCIERIN